MSPSNPKSKSKSTKKKVLELTDSEGWTHVLKGGKQDHSSTAALDKGIQALRLSSLATIDQVIQAYDLATEQWLKSPCYTKVSDQLAQTILAQPNLKLTKCVCLGLGRISQGLYPPMYELAALTSLLNIVSSYSPYFLSAASSEPSTSPNQENPHLNITQLIFQDPAFNELDKSFLTTHLPRVLPRKCEISIATTPAAFTEVNAHTFLFAVHIEHTIFAAALSNGAHNFPALCIANSTSPADLSLMQVDNRREALEKIQSFLGRRESWALPEFERNEWCRFTNVYWVEESEEGGKGAREVEANDDRERKSMGE